MDLFNKNDIIIYYYQGTTNSNDRNGKYINCFMLFMLVIYLDTPLRSIIETPLTDSLINGIFQLQNNVISSIDMKNLRFFFVSIQDGSFPVTSQLGQLFNVDFDLIKHDLNAKGLDPSSISIVIIFFI